MSDNHDGEIPVVSVEEVHLADHVCPECEQGKHPNCSGDAWCDACDGMAVCPCYWQALTVDPQQHVWKPPS
jgi:hypothetical protein